MLAGVTLLKPPCLRGRSGGREGRSESLRAARGCSAEPQRSCLPLKQRFPRGSSSPPGSRYPNLPFRAGFLPEEPREVLEGTPGNSLGTPPELGGERQPPRQRLPNLRQKIPARDTGVLFQAGKTSQTCMSAWGGNGVILPQTGFCCLFFFLFVFQADRNAREAQVVATEGGPCYLRLPAPPSRRSLPRTDAAGPGAQGRAGHNGYLKRKKRFM